MVGSTIATMNINFENTNHLVLNFYPDGYSLAFKLNEFPVFTSETILETAKISYEEMSLLDYIENEELPPLLVEMIDASPKLSQYKIWHNGCLILEIRDKISYRNNLRKQTNSVNGNGNGNRNTNSNNGNKNAHEYVKSKINGNGNGNNGLHHDSNDNGIKEAGGGYFILLKPSNLSMINDVKNLTDSEMWSTRERLQLESKIILHSSPPLFLDPIREEDRKSQLERVNDWPYKKPSNAFTRMKKKLPCPKLSSIRECGQFADINLPQRSNLPKDQANYIVDNLPPELTLQHFLATKRAAKKQSVAQMPRFHRFLKTKAHKF